MKLEYAFMSVMGMAFLTVACAASMEGTTRPAGKNISPGTAVLATGAALLQTDNPLEPMNIYLNGFHPMKQAPGHQVVAHHFCNQMNEDFAQCALFDGNTRTSNLTGIEYIISEKLFSTLPVEERKYWHPHNHEILSGQLVAPGLPDSAEKALMKGKINSYGKTWHLWNTGNEKMTGDRLPLGEPMLAWSFNREGEDEPGLVAGRDKAMAINSQKKRKQRAELTELAKPQTGVDALRDRFPRPTRRIPGVRDANSDTITLYTELHRRY